MQLLSRRERLRRSLDLPDASEQIPAREPRPVPFSLVNLDGRVPEGIAKSGGIPTADPAEWREPFVQWLDSACAFHPRVFGGVAALHNAFCDWEILQGEVPCNPDTFERLLRELGFLIGEVGGTMLVSGVAFREDVEAAGL